MTPEGKRRRPPADERGPPAPFVQGDRFDDRFPRCPRPSLRAPLNRRVEAARTRAALPDNAARLITTGSMTVRTRPVDCSSISGPAKGPRAAALLPLARFFRRGEAPLALPPLVLRRRRCFPPLLQPAIAPARGSARTVSHLKLPPPCRSAEADAARASPSDAPRRREQCSIRPWDPAWLGDPPGVRAEPFPSRSITAALSRRPSCCCPLLSPGCARSI